MVLKTLDFVDQSTDENVPAVLSRVPGDSDLVALLLPEPLGNGLRDDDILNRSTDGSIRAPKPGLDIPACVQLDAIDDINLMVN